MGVFQQLLDWLYLWHDRHRGPIRLNKHHRVEELHEHLTGYAIAGYEIRLYCQKKRYIRQYLWLRLPSLHYCTFRVFGRVTADAPEALRRACELDVDLPLLTPHFISESVQKEMAVRAYLDLLIERLSRERHFQPQSAQYQC